jgi:hypothetical protein
MEIKLKVAPSDTDADIMVDEYGALWKYSGPKRVHALLPATTKARDGEAIQGYYQNGALFIVDASEARKYFSSVNSDTWRDIHNT